jgi:PTS system cellobiose-specific IIB component
MNESKALDQKRINVLFCCGGGFSSTMVAYFEKQIQEYQMKEMIHFTFCPFLLSSKKYDAFDIIVCCPHLFRDVKRFNETYIHDEVPMYVLPIRMYGPTDVRELYWDIVDILEIYQKDPHNPVHFPGEEFCFDTWRRKAYRHTLVPVLNPFKKPKKSASQPTKIQS